MQVSIDFMGVRNHVISKSKKRSTKLLKEGRKYFKNKEDDKKLRCYACGYVKPASIEHEIVQLHHTDMISEIDKDGKEMTLEDAIKLLVPLCPTCMPYLSPNSTYKKTTFIC